MKGIFEGLRLAIVQQAADGKALPFPQLDLGLHLRTSMPGNSKSGDVDAVGEVQRAHFRRYLQADGVPRRDRRDKVQANAELLELNGDRSGSRRPVHPAPR